MIIVYMGKEYRLSYEKLSDISDIIYERFKEKYETQLDLAPKMLMKTLVTNFIIPRLVSAKILDRYPHRNDDPILFVFDFILIKILEHIKDEAIELSVETDDYGNVEHASIKDIKQYTGQGGGQLGTRRQKRQRKNNVR